MYRDVLYARISEDERGLEEGVTDQLGDSRALSAATGGEVVAELCDNDVSAFKGEERADYEKLLSMARAGEMDRVILTRTSRLWRNREERAAGIKVLGKAGICIKAVRGPELDLSSAAGRFLAGLLGEFDTADSEVKAELVSRATLRRAEEGRTSGGVMYGWRREYRFDDRGRRIGWDDVEDPEQAEVVREIVRRLLAGEARHALRRDFQGRGILNAAGKTEWKTATIRHLAARPANIGLRVYRAGEPDEMVYAAAWPAIVDHDDHDAVVQMLSGVSGAAHPSARKHLLTYGIGECGVCRSALRARGPRKTGAQLECLKGCVARSLADVERYVGDVVVERLRRPDAMDLLAIDQGSREVLHRQIEGVKARLAKAAGMWAAEALDDDQLAAANAELQPKLKQLLAQARAASVQPHLHLVTAMIDAPTDDIAARVWGAYTPHQKRCVLGILVDRVRILPVGRRPGFDPRFVVPDFKGQKKAGSVTAPADPA